MVTKILDSFALMAFLQDETGAQIVEDLILRAQAGKVDLAICVINLGEIWYSISRTMSVETADHYIQQLQSMPIDIINADWELTYQAAIYKAKGNISYADCFAAALANLRKGQVVTGDKEFEALKNEINILWLT